MSGFYSYLWLSADDTPYYVGKGTGNRAFDHHPRKTFCSVLRPWDKSRIIIFPQDSETDALESEQALIALFGLQTLLNRKEKGNSRESYTHSAETKIKIGLANTRQAIMRKRHQQMLWGRQGAAIRWGQANV